MAGEGVEIPFIVMAGLVPAIHVFLPSVMTTASALRSNDNKSWMAGTRPAMTMREWPG
jgi:hypothetical protein